MTINYHKQIESYESECVNLPESIREDLYAKREANRNRLKGHLPERIEIVNFIPQGSMAIRTTVQEKDNDYDVDDGVAFNANSLKGEILGIFDMTARQVQEMVLEAIKVDKEKFKKDPEIVGNCVRVYYSEGYHVDIPAFRVINAGEEDETQELAGLDGWKKSDPTQINRWFEDHVKNLNNIQDGAGGQFRKMIRLLKRFALSRGDKWDMPNGLKLTMLAHECFERSHERDDKAFSFLLKNLKARLAKSFIVYNRAQDDGEQDELTKTDADGNIKELLSRIDEALNKLKVTDHKDCTKKAAREAWEWIFQTNGFFKKYDDEHDDELGNTSVASKTPSGPFIKSETRFG